MKSPLVTLLMPTHSRVDVIGHAIRSVLAQTMGDFELLVVGDGCAAGTREVVESFKDHRLRFFDLPKAPFYGYANRNIVLREARGKYISYPSDDDLMLPDHLENLVAPLEAGAVLAHSTALWVSTDGVMAPFLTDLTVPSQRAQFMEGNTLCAGSIMYRADALARIDAWPEDVPSAADWILWKRILDENPSKQVAYVPRPGYLHFSALWKKSRNSGMQELLRQLEIADQADWWPEELRLPVAEGKSEQEVFASALFADPTDFSRRVRDGVLKLNSRIAWDFLRIGRPAFDHLKHTSQNVIEELQARIASLDADCVQLNDRLHHLAVDNDRLTAEIGRLERSEAASLQYRDELQKIKRSRIWKTRTRARNMLRHLQGKPKDGL